jgi:primosomal protein N' (replication factor Y)
MPRHDVIQAALLADPTRVIEAERQRRQLLDLPPATALAHVSGTGSAQVVRQLCGVDGISVGGGDEDYLVRATDWERLGSALVATERPRGSRVRIVVDPPRV